MKNLIFIFSFNFKRCDQLIYFTDAKSSNHQGGAEDPEMTIVYLSGLAESSPQKEVIRYAYEHTNLEFDWLLYATDDTYVVMENLRRFLAQKCGDEKRVYGAAASSWLISRGSIRIVGAAMRKEPSFCAAHNSEKKVDMFACLNTLGVVTGETRDTAQRDRFLTGTFNE